MSRTEYTWIIGVFDKEGRIESRLIEHGESSYHGDYWENEGLYPLRWRYVLYDWQLSSFDVNYRGFNRDNELLVEAVENEIFIKYVYSGIIEAPSYYLWGTFYRKMPELPDEKMFKLRDKFDALSYQQQLESIKKGKIVKK